MIDRLVLSATPVAEDCAQVGSDNYHERAVRECREFISQLRRQFGHEPEGAGLRVIACAHDFGTYHVVACSFDSDMPEAEDYAFKLDAETPEYWDEEAVRALGLVR